MGQAEVWKLSVCSPSVLRDGAGMGQPWVPAGPCFAAGFAAGLHCLAAAVPSLQLWCCFVHGDEGSIFITTSLSPCGHQVV